MKNSGKSETDSLREAFGKVIENSKIKTIGDFHITTITETGPQGLQFFRYFEKFILNSGRSQVIILKPIVDENQKQTQSQTFTVNWGSAEYGSFGLFYFVSVTHIGTQ